MTPWDGSPSDSSVHGILQARILEWVAIPFSRGSSRPRDRTQIFCIAGRFFTILATRGAHFIHSSVYMSIPISQFSPTPHSPSVQFTQSCPTPCLCNPMNCSTPGLPVHHQLPEFTPTHVHWVNDAIQPSHPLSSPSPPAPIPPSIRVFFSESTLHMRWPKYWSFSFSISPSNEHPGLISF